MGKFSGSRAPGTYTPPAPASIIRTTDAPVSPTHQGGPGYARDAKSELYVLAVSAMVNEDTFYEGAAPRDERFRALIRQLSAEDPAWVARLIPYLRLSMLMRSASVVAAAEYAVARKGVYTAADYASKTPSIRSVVDSACQRADEPAELLGYWLSRYGRNVPSAVKRGLSDATARLYTERNALKYDGGSRRVRMGDVIELIHPTPDNQAQSDLYRWLLDTRHGRAEIDVPASLAMIRQRAYLEGLPVSARREMITPKLGGGEVSHFLAQAGMTWEGLAGWLQGPMDATAWEAIIPSMGYMALLRNLRNFSEVGVSEAMRDYVRAKLMDPEQVAKSRQFPFRFLSAYRAVEKTQRIEPIGWAYALETALNLSLSNVPRLAGRTLVLVDWSGSMFGVYGGYHRDDADPLQPAEKATLFGGALATRAGADACDLFAYGTTLRQLRVHRDQSLLKLVASAENLGGTDTIGSLRATFKGHDRVLIITDEQVGYGRGGELTSAIPAHVPLYTWNLGGYSPAQVASGPNRHAFAGLTDKAFAMIPLLEASSGGEGWPW